MKINNKGYASTIIMFSILTLFLISMLMLVKTMNNSSSLNKKITEKVVDNINYDASGSVQDRLSVLENKVSNLKSEVINEIYPVGSIYMSTEDDTIEKVQSKFGGTWEKITDRFLIGASTSYPVTTIGGNETHYHKSPLTWIEGSPSYVGTTNIYGYSISTDRDFFGAAVTKYEHNVSNEKLLYNTSVESNIPPYYSVYMYRRIK